MMTKIIPQLSERDHAVVQLVAQFRQLTAAHIRDGLFADLASQTPLDRCLKRLHDGKYLARLRRLVGGDQGGSSQFVYQLGRAGWKLLDKPGHFWAPRAVNLHTLAIADCFTALKRADHAGELVLLDFTTEPDCHTSVGTVSLTPDAYVEVGNAKTSTKFTYWLEVDQGTEHADKLQDKCQRYWQAYQRWTGEYFPTVLFVVPDERRKQAVGRLVAAGPAEARALFGACTRRQLSSAVTRNDQTAAWPTATVSSHDRTQLEREC